MPDASMLMHLVATPASIAATAICICLMLQSLRWTYFAGLIAALSIGLGPLLGLFLEEGVALPPERDWHLVLGMFLATSCAIGIIQVRFLQALMICVLATGSAHFIFPSPDVEAEFQPYRIYWLVAIATSSYANAYLFSRTATNGAQPWSAWVLVAQLAVISLAIALNYATLAFSAIGILSATAMFSTVATITALWRKAPQNETGDSVALTPVTTWPLVALVPIAFTAPLLALCFRIYNFGTVAVWVYLPLLYLPTLVLGIDQIFLGSQSTRKRVFVAMLVTTAISVAVVLYLVLTGSSEDY